jgi:hypothetical protein
MMIILALRSNPDYIYERALLYFSPDDIAEAFASTKSVTIPSQSRSSLALLKRAEGTDIVARFRELAPDREPVSIQRWSVRRVALGLGLLAVLIVFIGMLIENALGSGFI